MVTWYSLPRERGRPSGMICLPSRFDVGEGCNFIGSRAIRQPTRGGVVAWGLLTEEEQKQAKLPAFQVLNTDYEGVV